MAEGPVRRKRARKWKKEMEAGKERWETGRQKERKGNGTEMKSGRAGGEWRGMEENPTGRGHMRSGAKINTLKAGVRNWKGDNGGYGEY